MVCSSSQFGRQCIKRSLMAYAGHHEAAETFQLIVCVRRDYLTGIKRLLHYALINFNAPRKVTLNKLIASGMLSLNGLKSSRN